MKQVDQPYPTHVAGIHFPHLLMSASGPRDVTEADCDILGESGAGAIVTKTATRLPREGNPEPRFVSLPLGAIQSMGIPNLGYEAYIEMSHRLKRHGKPLIASLAGLEPGDFPVLVKGFQASAFDLLEVNLSCPNIAGKPQVAYDLESTRRVLDEIVPLSQIPLGLKLPPYLDDVLIESMAKLILEYPIRFVTSINSAGHSLAIDIEQERPFIRPRGGKGGLSGRYVKPMALGNVRGFYEQFGDKVDIIAVGGILTGEDLFEFMLCGAKAAQIGVAYWDEGPAAFERISKEFHAVMTRKGYTSLEQVIGKLKPYSADE